MKTLLSIYISAISLFSQEQQTNMTDPSFSPKSDITATIPSANFPEPVEDDPESRMRIIQYQSNNYNNIVPLAKEAEKNGFTATPDEITTQQNAIKSMYPEMQVFENQLRDEIIARKYSQTLNGVRISDADLQSAYKQMQTEYSNGKAPVMNDVLPLLQMRVILENRFVQAKIQEINDLRDTKTNQNVLKAKETWPAEDVRILGPGNMCIAEHKDSNTCLLTIKNYNDFVPYYLIPKSFPLDSARIMTIRDILTDLYIAQEAQVNGFAVNDSAIDEKNRWKQDYVRRLKSNKLGKMVWDPISLQRSYWMFYEVFFQTCYYPHFSIIGSNDSLYIDSISRTCRLVTLEDSQNGKEIAKQSVATPALPWSYSRGVLLPAEFNAVDTLRIAATTPLIKTPYGFFVVRLDSVSVRYEIPIQEANEKVIVLATKQKYFKMDSLLEAKARSIYASNRRLNHMPDTLTVKAILTPEFTHDSVQEVSIPTRKGTLNVKADSLESGVEISSACLPFDVRDSLLSRFEASQGNKKMIGPIHSRFGVWNFMVIGRKRPGKACPFSYVQKRLIDSLVVHEIDCGVDFSWDNPDSSFDKTALAKSYAYRFFGGNDYDLQEEKKPGRNSKELLDQKVCDRNNEIDAWLSKITIHSETILASSHK